MILFLNEANSISQTLFYQDICNCGTTGAGFSSGIEGGVINAILNVNLNPTATIKKAYLIFNRYGNPNPLEISFNGSILMADSTSQVGVNYLSYNSPTEVSAVHVLEVTDKIFPTQNSYSLAYTEDFPVVSVVGTYGAFYLIVVYEDNSLNETAISVFLNDKNTFTNMNFNFSNLFPINNLTGVGLALHSDIIGVTIVDTTSIFLNTNFIGVIGGNDQINSSYTGGGVKGHFYFENNQLYGLDDDTPDNVVGGTDGLVDIQDYVSFEDTFFDLNNINPTLNTSYNVFIAFYLAYTTTCDTFSVSLLTEDTTICKGDSLQFIASGADSYAWTPNLGLSCDDCANPKISPQQSTTYFLTSTKYGNCKKVQPIKIRVVDKPVINSFVLTADTCGENSGAVSSINASGVAPLSFSLNGNSNSSFSNLQSGWYNLAVTDAQGCMADSLLFIENIIAAEAGFTANPNIGFVPLTVDFINESRYATNYIWYINGDTITDENASYVFDSVGTYTVMQIAYNANSWCADTVTTTVYVYPPINIFIPNIITANNDGINDDFTIQVEGGEYVWWHIYNRWGNLVYENEKHISTHYGDYDLWDGIDFNFDQPVTDGVYFYHILVKSPVGTTEIYTGSLTVAR